MSRAAAAIMARQVTEVGNFCSNWRHRTAPSPGGALLFTFTFSPSPGLV
jgi:hypothetical protein